MLYCDGDDVILFSRAFSSSIDGGGEEVDEADDPSPTAAVSPPPKSCVMREDVRSRSNGVAGTVPAETSANLSAADILSRISSKRARISRKFMERSSPSTAGALLSEGAIRVGGAVPTGRSPAERCICRNRSRNAVEDDDNEEEEEESVHTTLIFLEREELLAVPFL